MLKLVKLNRVLRPDPYDNEEGEPERSAPVNINPVSVRCFYARKDNRPGTRITFNDGGGFAVTEPVEVVEAMLTGRLLPALPAPTA